MNVVTHRIFGLMEENLLVIPSKLTRLCFRCSRLFTAEIDCMYEKATIRRYACLNTQSEIMYIRVVHL
jgi:hypothetical protein